MIDNNLLVDKSISKTKPKKVFKITLMVFLVEIRLQQKIQIQLM